MSNRLDLSICLGCVALIVFCFMIRSASAAEFPADLKALIENRCLDCHNSYSAEGGLDLESLTFDLEERLTRNRWVRIFNRVDAGEMPPEAGSLSVDDRKHLVDILGNAITTVDRKDVLASGRGPLRRLNRDEYQQNLRDVLQLPNLDIRDMLPEDREEHRFNKSATSLDMSWVQLTAYLEAADAALKKAMATSAEPPPVTKYRANGTQLFSTTSTFGEREAMFFAKDNKAVATNELDQFKDDPALEMALFRSASWPYYGYPRSFVARLAGEYRVRFSARAVLQTEGYQLKPAIQSVPMTFRARKPSGADVSGDVRATGGIMDIEPESKVYETTIRLLPTETFEYSLLGLPVPLARNVNGGPPTYRYPPFPEGGQPGVAFQWLEVEGPISHETWPPPSHHVLFDEFGTDVQSQNPVDDARRLLRRFVKIAAREPVPEEAILRYEQLILERLEMGSPFAEAMLTGYKAFLCSSHFLYLPEPSDPATSYSDQYAIASRLSHFLTNTRPDASLMSLAETGKLRNTETLRSETDRLIASSDFERFVQNFTDYWLNLRHIRRDEPDIRLHPEYRFDD
ncbi:MAG TPA: hypothetical protein DIW81_15620, partial [Planctomycetaceae bacterium]|nr:hypothetical protein [Planctomycetaceae bacterium]